MKNLYCHLYKKGDGFKLGNIILVLSKILPVLLLIAVGVLLQKIRFFNNGVIGGIKRLIVNVSLPSLLFTAFLNTRFETRYLVIVGFVILTCLIMLGVGRIAAPALKIESPYFPLLVGGFETGMVGYSLFGSVYGTENVSIMGIVDLGQEIFVFIILLTMLLKLKDGARNAKDTIKSFLMCPVIIAIALGIIAGSCGISDTIKSSAILNSVLETVSMLAAPTIPLICIAIGYEMKLDLKSIWMPLKTIITRMLCLVCFALLLNEFVIDRILHLDRIFQVALLVMFILPPPFIIPLYIKEEDEKNKHYILNTLTLNTLTTLAAFFIISAIYI
jgi:predicted permease